MTTKTKASSAASKSDLFETDELVALARLDIERNQLDEALWKLKQAQTDAAAPPEAAAMLARLYAQLGLWDRAKPLFERYLAAQPNAINETFQLGMVHFDSGQTEEAIKIWEKLLQTQPIHPPALFYRALAKHQTGQSAEARHSLDVLLKSAPPDNLYFGRARELLQVIDTQPTMAAGTARGVSTGASSAPLAPRDAYKTEH